MPGTTGVPLQARQVLRIEAPLPTVESLRADVKVTAGETGVMTLRLVVIKPFEPMPGFFREVRR